jgi:small GTP-binding protein
MSYGNKIIKTVLIGDAGVGKTSILSVYCSGVFSLDYSSTIGVDFGTKTLEVNQKKVRLQLWDTAGQERFRSITHSYYRGAQVVLLVIDLTNKLSVRRFPKWLDDIDTILPFKNEYQLVIVGNKIDGEIAEGYEAMRSLIEDRDLNYYMVSARKNVGLEDMFEEIVEKEVEKDSLIDLDDHQPSTLILEASSKKSTCC